MAVTYQTEGVKMPDIKKRETTEWIKTVAASYGKRLGEIAYIFCSDEKILDHCISRLIGIHIHLRTFQQIWSKVDRNRLRATGNTAIH